LPVGDEDVHELLVRIRNALEHIHNGPADAGDIDDQTSVTQQA